MINVSAGSVRRISLDQWNAEANQEVGGTISPVSESANEVTSILSANLITNGSFNTDIAGWEGWPTSGIISRDVTYLDNGALKTTYNANTGSNEYYLRSPFANVQNGEWYQMRFNTQSNLRGTLRAEFKSQTEATSATSMSSREVSFGPQRRDLNIIFQANSTEPGQMVFAHKWYDDTYWMDNVELYRVAVQPVDPYAHHVLVKNPTNQSTSMPLDGCWKDANDVSYCNSIELGEFQSNVLYQAPPTPPPAATPSTNVSLLVQASTTSAPSITLSWSSYTSATGYLIYRKLKTATSWGSAIATPSGTATQYTDNSVSTGVNYEYKIRRNSSSGTAYGYVSSGVQVPATGYKGRMVLVVDNTFTTSMAADLTTLQSDLKLDGWNVTRIDVARTATPASVRSQIQTVYNADPSNVKAVYLFGHVPVYRSGNIAPDGHDPIPWASDSYYGEMTSTWSGSQTTLPSDVELQVGRVDLYNMPAFSQSEEQLLRAYLNKARQFKLGAYVPNNQGLIQDNYSGWVSDPLVETGYRTMGPLVGINNIDDLAYNGWPQFWSVVGNGYLWTFAGGGGVSYSEAQGIGSTANFVASPHNGVFNMVLGSYYGNWDANSSSIPGWNGGANSFIRAPLASGKALTNVFAGIPCWFFHHMGMGDNIGYSTLLSQNNRTASPLYVPQNNGWQGEGYTTIHLSLMGDPSLRMNYPQPASNLQITNNGSTLTLNWTAAAGSPIGYYLYSIVAGVQTLAHPSLITGTTITGTFPSATGTEYMIRAVRSQVTPSGNYFNQSLGITAAVPPSTTTSVLVSPKVFLQGPTTGTLMSDALRAASLLPLNDPYPSTGYTHVGSVGVATTPSVLQITGNNAVVDWVVVELRNASTPSTKVFTRSALLLRNGSVVDVDGVSPVQCVVPNGSYYVAIHHRNHLGVMTANPIALGSVTSTVNFSLATTPTWGTNAQRISGTTAMMWAGDVNRDGVLKYTGLNNDRDLILSKIGGSVATNVVVGYYLEDVNLNGIVSYTGANNDRDLILYNIGGVVATNTVIAQLP